MQHGLRIAGSNAVAQAPTSHCAPTTTAANTVHDELVPPWRNSASPTRHDGTNPSGSSQQCQRTYQANRRLEQDREAGADGFVCGFADGDRGQTVFEGYGSRGTGADGINEIGVL
jgi:hypothetical protein